MANDWYYIIDGDTQLGPVSKEQIESMLSSGDLKPEMFICSPSVPQWTKAEDIDELKWERPFVPPPFATAKSKESAEDVAIPGKGDQPSTKVKTTEQDRWLEAIALSRTDEYLKDYMPVDSNDHTTIEQIRDAKIDGRMWKGHWYVLRPKMDGTTAGQSLEAKGITTKRIKMVTGRCCGIFKIAGIKTLAGITPSKAENALTAVTGHGGQKLTSCTKSAYLQAIKQFCRWAVQHGRMTTNPIEHLSVKLAGDVTKRRRPLTVEEVRLLVTNTVGGPDRHRIGGPERGLI